MHPRLKELFERAASLPPNDQLPFLARECGGDRALYDELVSLLDADENYDWPIDVHAFNRTDHRTVIKDIIDLIDDIEEVNHLKGDDEDPNQTKIAPEFHAEKLIAGRYRVISDEPIGKGGTGHVYLAIDTNFNTNNRVALKRLRNRNHEEVQIFLSNQFQREAEILRSLRHTGIPGNIDIVKEEGEVHLVMEFIDGDDLDRMLDNRNGRPFETQQVLGWAEELLEILVYLHTYVRTDQAESSDKSKAIIHRDIKPANLKIRAGKLMLIDFGFAKSGALELSSSDPKFNPYTLHYASPEQLNNEPATVLFDIYSVGATLYTLLTGIAPAHAKYRSDLIQSGNDDPIKPIEELNARAPEGLCRLVYRAMAMAPQKRPQSAEEMLAEIRNIKASPEKKGAHSVPVPPNLLIRYGKIAGAVVSLGLVAWVIWPIFSPSPEFEIVNSVDSTRTTNDREPEIPSDEEDNGPDSGEDGLPVGGDIDDPLDPINPPIETPPVRQPDPSHTTRTVVLSNLYVDRIQGEPLNGLGNIQIDGASLGSTQWNEYTLSVGTHTLSASFRGVKAQRVTLTYTEGGQQRSEVHNIGSSGSIRIQIRPEMENLRILFHI